MNLYQEEILDHYRNPRNFGRMENPDLKVEETNASCGDELALYLKLDSGTVKEVMFEGEGCALSLASASMLTEFIKGKKIIELEKLGSEEIFKLLGVKISLTRFNCLSLGFKALKKAIKNYQEER